MEARGDTDVRIFRKTWVLERKANLTIQLLVPSEVHIKLAFEQLHQVSSNVVLVGIDTCVFVEWCFV